MKTALILACALGSLGIAQAAAVKNPDPMPGASRDECVFVSNISNWTVLDNRNVVLFTANQKKAYLMQLGMPLTDLRYAFKVAFIDRDRDGQLCGRSTDKVAAVGVGAFREPSSTIMGLTRLDDAGLQSLEDKYKMKLGRKRDNKDAPQGQTSPSPAA
ncbi:MAG TPA: DUF6491 family protein [Povalibacter sp.]|nr:DUF6491 family protein [Povalibacter sp.]